MWPLCPMLLSGAPQDRGWRILRSTCPSFMKQERDRNLILTGDLQRENETCTGARGPPTLTCWPWWTTSWRWTIRRTRGSCTGTRDLTIFQLSHSQQSYGMWGLRRTDIFGLQKDRRTVIPQAQAIIKVWTQYECLGNTRNYFYWFFDMK